jgi:hypothetical protein
MNTSDKIQLLLAILTLIMLLVTIIIAFIQFNLFKKQQRLLFFAEYTKRYQEIMLNLPASIANDDFNINQLNSPEKDNYLKYMRAYFDLCSEEYNLFLNGYIDKEIWSNWEQGIKYSMSKHAFIQAWNIIELNSDYYPDYLKWFNKKIK